jgi:hypothetical protein
VISLPIKKETSEIRYESRSAAIDAHIDILEEYETQIKIPKPILIEIFLYAGLENFLRISLISKQFYFLVKSDNLWLKILREKLSDNEIEEQRKSKKLVDIYKDTICGWDIPNSYHTHVFVGNILNFHFLT